MTEREKVVEHIMDYINAVDGLTNVQWVLAELDILKDALALLKAQEPRVMAYEELSTFDGAFIIESSAVHPLEWVFFFDTDAKSDAVWVQGFDGERYIVYREDYGIYVRCWTSRPDQATREAVKWDAQEQRDYEAAVEMAEYCERYEPTYNADDGSM